MSTKKPTKKATPVEEVVPEEAVLEEAVPEEVVEEVPTSEPVPAAITELPPAPATTTPPEIAFYDADGMLMFWYQGGVVDPPEGAVYQAEVEQGIIIADTWYDVSRERLMKRTPFPITVSEGKISGIPKGTRAFVDGELVVVDNGVLTTSNPEGSVVRLVHFKHIMQDVLIPN